MRKRPVLYGILILLIISAFFFLIVYTSAWREGPIMAGADKVGVISITGVISDSQGYVEEIKEFADNKSIRALVVRIDSPGGGVAASQEIYQALLQAKKKKTVVASLGALAASGGYLIACAADQIVANPGTLTGSISAIMHFPNVEELFKKLGIKSTVIKSGKYKDVGSPVREMTRDEKALVQDLVDDIYEQFLEIIITARNIPRAEIIKVADGRVFTGRRAKELKLVDHLGDLCYAIELAARLAGIEGEPRVVHTKKKISSWWDLLLTRYAPAGRLMEQTLHPTASYLYF